MIVFGHFDRVGIISTDSADALNKLYLSSAESELNKNLMFNLLFYIQVIMNLILIKTRISVL